MHKVVVERPRWNPGPGKQLRQANLEFDLLPLREGIRRRHRCRKSFTDLLGPLRRWLQAQLGRPWNDVYSEACAVIKPDSVVRAHIKTHLLEMVERQTFMHEGRICVLDERAGLIVPVHKRVSRWRRFYVDPNTGLLRGDLLWQRRGPRTDRSRRELDAVRRWTSDGRLLVKIQQSWFEFLIGTFGADSATRPFDRLFNARLSVSHAWEVYGRSIYCRAKRQLSGRELRQFSLSNSVDDSSPDLFSLLGEDLVGRIQRSNGNPVRPRLQRIACVLKTRPAGRFAGLSHRDRAIAGSNPVVGVCADVAEWSMARCQHLPYPPLPCANTFDGPKTSDYPSLVQIQSAPLTGR